MSRRQALGAQLPPTTSVLFKIVLAFEGLPADFASEGNVVLVAPLVDHEVVGLGEPPLAVFADELALGSHLAPKLPPILRLNLHYGEHLGPALSLSFLSFSHALPLSLSHSLSLSRSLRPSLSSLSLSPSPRWTCLPLSLSLSSHSPSLTLSDSLRLSLF